MSNIPRGLIEYSYAEYAREYARKLPLEHYMESTPQSTQRKITLASLELVHARRPEVQVFNELLVQYPLPRKRRPGQVVPDNMVVIHSEPIQAVGSYDTPLQPVGPFWTLEYVSKNNKRKDYVENFAKYEQELKVPYYLAFYPDNQEMNLWHLKEGKYVSVQPNAIARCPMPELEMELGLLDGWVRFWFRGKLLPLPADLQVALDEATQRADQATQRADQATQRADQATQRADQATQRADQATQRADQATQRADQATQRADQATQRADEATQLADKLQTDLDRERKRTEDLEQELKRLRAQHGQSP